MNPGQGLKIVPFKDAHLPQAMADRELDKLARYMVHIASTHEDFRQVDHKVRGSSVGAMEWYALMLSDRAELAVRRAGFATRMKTGCSSASVHVTRRITIQDGMFSALSCYFLPRGISHLTIRDIQWTLCA